jgi:hypothetical protein
MTYNVLACFNYLGISHLSARDGRACLLQRRKFELPDTASAASVIMFVMLLSFVDKVEDY